MCQIQTSLFNSEIMSLLYQEGGRIEEIIEDLITPDYLITPKGGYHWNEEKKLWLPKTFYELIEEIYLDLESYQDKYKLPLPTKETISCRILPRLQKNDWDKKLNCKRHLFPILNGQVLNLETLTTRPREKKDLFSFECPVTYTSNSLHDVNDIMLSFCQSNSHTCQRLQSLLGYFLTGLTTRKCFYNFLGDNTLKKYIFRLLIQILGPFYHSVTSQQDLSSLRGKRLIFFTEPNIIDSSTLELLYHNSTCKYLLPSPSSPQRQPSISIRLSPHIPHSSLLSNFSPASSLTLDDFFSWCCQGACQWFQYRRNYVDSH